VARIHSATARGRHLPLWGTLRDPLSAVGDLVGRIGAGLLVRVAVLLWAAGVLVIIVLVPQAPIDFDWRRFGPVSWTGADLKQSDDRRPDRRQA
jgi:hypothetical protein